MGGVPRGFVGCSPEPRTHDRSANPISEEGPFSRCFKNPAGTARSNLPLPPSCKRWDAQLRRLPRSCATDAQPSRNSRMCVWARFCTAHFSWFAKSPSTAPRKDYGQSTSENIPFSSLRPTNGAALNPNARERLWYICRMRLKGLGPSARRYCPEKQSYVPQNLIEPSVRGSLAVPPEGGLQVRFLLSFHDRLERGRSPSANQGRLGCNFPRPAVDVSGALERKTAIRKTLRGIFPPRNREPILAQRRVSTPPAGHTGALAVVGSKCSRLAHAGLGPFNWSLPMLCARGGAVSPFFYANRFAWESRSGFLEPFCVFASRS